MIDSPVSVTYCAPLLLTDIISFVPGLIYKAGVLGVGGLGGAGVTADTVDVGPRN